MKKVMCEEYSKILNEKHFFEILMDQMIYDEHFEAIVLFNHMKRQAEIDNIVLLDTDEWDYENYFDALYSAKESLSN